MADLATTFLITIFCFVMFLLIITTRLLRFAVAITVAAGR